MSPEAFAALVQRGPFLGGEAVDAGLIDGLAYRDQVIARIEELAGAELEALGPRAYLRRNGRPHERGTGVALIYGDGAVQRGRSGYDPIFGATSMGSDTVSKAFRDAIEDDEIRAIILRIDSPGGSYVASDAIWRMTVKAREAGKPVVGTMGNTAASGGYFVAMATDLIIAQPGTITGSIGVLGGKLLTEAAWEENLGVRWDWEQTHPNAGMYGGLQDYTEQGWQRHQDWLDRVYDDFTAKVAAGRGMSQGEVHEVAKGRVWTGAQSLEIGLVDRLGGFGEAYAAVRELLAIEADAPLDIRVLPRPRPWYERLRRGGEEAPPVSLAAAVRVLEELQPLARDLRRAGVIGDRHALEMPLEVEVR
jgi:protease IV